MTRNNINNRSRAAIETLEDRRLKSCEITPYNFDLNRDGEISGDDFYVVDAHLGQNVRGWANGDIDNNGVVDEIDQCLLTSAYEQSLYEQPTVTESDPNLPLADSVQIIVVMKPGDANGDGEVNGDDFFILDSNPIRGREGNWSDGDFNGDGYVDDADYIIINATCDTDEFGNVIDSDEWVEIDSVLAQDAVGGFFS
jgi:hypothetical protein